MSDKGSESMGNKTAAWVGTGLHLLIGALMVCSGIMKLVLPGDMIPEDVSNGVRDHIRIIGAGEIAAAVMLLPAEFLPIGMLLCSSFWGGAIMAHMTKSEGYAPQAVLLVLTWAGGALRRPDLLPFGSEKPLPTEPESRRPAA